MSVEIHLEDDICGRLIAMLRNDIKGRLRVGDLVSSLQDRAFSLVIFLLALPNGVPGPSIPGLSTLTGLPVFIFSFEAALGRKHPRLPRFVNRFRLNRYTVIRHLERVRPYIARLENRMHPRLPWLVARQHINYALCALYSFVLIAPIPFGNIISGWAVIILSMGLVLRDGLFVLLGHLVGIIAIIWNLALIVLGVELYYYLSALLSG